MSEKIHKLTPVADYVGWRLMLHRTDLKTGVSRGYVAYGLWEVERYMSYWATEPRANVTPEELTAIGKVVDDLKARYKEYRASLH